MSKAGRVVIAGLTIVLSGSAGAWAQGTVAVAVPARAGAVDGTAENSDAFIWRKFAEFVAPVGSQQSPVVFETWASDADTFPAPAQTARWPAPNEPKKLHASTLIIAKQLAVGASPAAVGPLAGPIDVKCEAPKGAAAGAFPLSGTPPPCIAEETKRNRAQFDYLKDNNLNTKAGLAAAFAKSFKVEMPLDAIAVKGDWVPVTALLQWIPQLGNKANVEQLYYTNTVDGVEYALVSLHASSRQNPNWVWGTFEHQMTPGRCDYMGCFDSFGAEISAFLPNKSAPNAQYGACRKTPALQALMRSARISPVWENYCLKSTMVDYVAADGTPYVLGNSVIEGIVGDGTVAASSCISCHAYASFDASGATKPTVRALLPFNPTGKPIPGALEGSSTFAFMWGVLLAK
jgi:hypothetical protein